MRTSPLASVTPTVTSTILKPRASILVSRIKILRDGIVRAHVHQARAASEPTPDGATSAVIVSVVILMLLFGSAGLQRLLLRTLHLLQLLLGPALPRVGGARLLLLPIGSALCLTRWHLRQWLESAQHRLPLRVPRSPHRSRPWSPQPHLDGILSCTRLTCCKRVKARTTNINVSKVSYVNM